MSIMGSLAVRQLLKNKKRTLIAIVGIILSVSMVTAVAGFVVSTQDMFRRTYIELRGNYHVGFGPVSEEQAQAVAADSRVESSYTELSQDEKLIVYFRIQDVDRKYAETADNIANDYGIDAEYFDYHKELLAAEGVIASDQSLRALYSIAGILGLVILIGSIIVIANAFYISASERMIQFGVLKSAGATKEQIRQTVLAEGFVLSLIAIPLGILAGLAVEAVALAIANKLLYEVSQLNHGVIYFRLIISGWAIAGSVVISLVTVFLSAWIPASRAAKISAIEAITLSHEVSIRPGEVRVSPAVYKLFGFEGSLAAKALKRSRRKYRATVVSLVVSIVLFVLGSGFGTMLTKSTDIIYRDFGVNVIMNYRDGDVDTIRGISERLAELPGELSSSKVVHAQTAIPEYFISGDAKEYWGGEIQETITDGDESASNIQFIAVNDAEFEDICRSAGVSPDWLDEEEALKGILMNFAITDIYGKRIEFQPFHYKKGESLTVSRQNSSGEYTLELLGYITDIPTSIAPFVHIAKMSVILPESAFEVFSRGASIPQAYWVVKAENPAGYCEAAEEIFKSAAPDGRYGVVNYEQGARITQSLNQLMMVFVYGFIGMLSLIAVTSVLGTISTNITLRMPEFAMLSSVGMTFAGLRRMLNLESLFYGLRALAIGLPISVALYYLLYQAFGISVDFAFIWPWKSLTVCVAAVMFITFGTMRYSTKMLEGKNIVELIRKINI